MVTIWKPFWLVAGIVLTVLSLIFLTLIFILSGKSDQFSDEISFGKSYGAPTLLRKAIPPPPPPAVINDDQLEVITSLLKKDIFENKIRDLNFENQDYFEKMLPVMLFYLKNIKQNQL